MDGTLTPLQRFFLAFVAFFAVLFNRRFAEEVHLLRERQRALPPGAPPLPEAQPPSPAVPAPRAGASEAGRTAPAPSAAPAAAPPAAAAPPPIPAPKPAAKAAPEHAESLQVIALLQRDGRLLDFLEESLEGFSDSEIGAAARTVHAGCKKALAAYLELEPVLREPEGARVTVAAGFDPAAVRLTGNVVGQPPFKGALRHHGWRAARTSFPPLPGHDPRILAAAEVEL
ncbi:DUF2760 domain-containing protein [Anaeromyxobacter diazotrophicus]|uniref:DUF2760 domain-containing protein n=1 Tax=Anaeromyxobacter diazotrophicus TaxID=2590199 RepID=A0A7I9VP65_9BACT|nr:DUF2760 domain-containing protein [Anaeromyxobacter diazotrophicus]GEJ58193.1 hypothetical protein AMYX_29340 [Anaeromyxobacter diazotrophicus]